MVMIVKHCVLNPLIMKREMKRMGKKEKRKGVKGKSSNSNNV